MSEPAAGAGRCGLHGRGPPGQAGRELLGPELEVARLCRQLVRDGREQALNVVRLLGRRLQETHLIALSKLLADVRRDLSLVCLVYLVAWNKQQ